MWSFDTLHTIYMDIKHICAAYDYFQSQKTLLHEVDPIHCNTHCSTHWEDLEVLRDSLRVHGEHVGVGYRGAVTHKVMPAEQTSQHSLSMLTGNRPCITLARICSSFIVYIILGKQNVYGKLQN